MYMLWRLKTMLGTGEFDFQGEVKNMKEFEVKGKSVQAAPAGETTNT
jgi:hypothetical protein